MNHLKVARCLCLLLLPLEHPQAAPLTLTAPSDHQVCQRENRVGGLIPIQGRLEDAVPDQTSLEARLVVNGEAGEWRRLHTTFTNGNFSTTLTAPSGGWHRLEMRASGPSGILATATVEHVGIGEVFFVAGQSNAANHGEERQSAASDKVVTFDGRRWQHCTDPQPGASGNGGSFLPPLGDALARRFGVPVGFVACGIGATSVREWLPRGTRFPNPPTLTGRVEQLPDGEWASKGAAFDMLVERMRQLGPRGFRAVLWHQGESDANQQDPTRTLPGPLYRKYLERLIRESRRAIGWDAPWFVAQVSYHVPGDEASPDIRAAQASLGTDGIALPGPDSDALKGDLRENHGKGVHFSATGLRVHASVWADKVAPWLDGILEDSTSAPDASVAANLLPNPSFENGVANQAADWKPRAWSGESNCQWAVDSPGRTDGRCLAILSRNGSDAAWTAMVPVKTNTAYRLSGWIRTREVRGAVGALLNVQNLQPVRTPRVAGTTDWTHVSTVFLSGAESALEINCLFGGWGQSTGQAWFDDVALEPLPADWADRPQATLTINPDAPRVPRSPMLFGGFIEHFDGQIYGGIFEPGSPLSDERGFRQDVIAALKELKLSVVRWPGGCFASGYHWRDGVGPSRRPVPDPVWGVVDPNTFGTDEFVEWCRLVGCEPYICSNAGNGTPEEMRDWVAWCNARIGPVAGLRAESGNPEPRDVRFWSIGNENWGGHEIGAKTPQEWGPLVARSAALMRAVDPTLTLLAAATPNRDWTLPLLRAAGDQLDYVAIHEYWLPCWGENLTPDYPTCIAHSGGPEDTITRVIEILEEAGVRGRIRIAFDEWNLRGWHHPGFPRKEAVDPDDAVAAAMIQAREKNAIASQYTMADALFSASFLNACLRHAADVGLANIAPIVNTRGPLFVHPGGLVKRTTFHTLALYANELEDRVAGAEIEATPLALGNATLPVVDGIATVNADGTTWAVALVNRHPSQYTACRVRLGTTALDRTFPATLLAGDSPDAYNDLEHPTRVAPQHAQLPFSNGVVSLPPHSLTIVRFPATRRDSGTGGQPLRNSRISAAPTPGPLASVVNVWPAGRMPGQGADAAESTVERNDGFHRITNVSHPTLTLFPAQRADSRPAPAVIVCPGGGYRYVVVDKEGSEIAAWLNAAGITALVLKYRVPDNREGARQDLQRAIRLVRAHANEWNIDSQRVGVIGFSAGGHLAATASTQFGEPAYTGIDAIDEHGCRPDFAMLVYPAYLDDKQGHASPDLDLGARIPPTLIVHSEDDRTHVVGSKVYAAALRDAKVTHEFRLYPTGGHGYGLHCEKEARAWPDDALKWLQAIGIR